MSSKKLRISEDQILPLASGFGTGMATDKIMVDGETIEYMYRETPITENDSGWRFLSATEDQDYVDDPENSGFYDINIIANYEPSIISYLKLPIGTELQRIEGTKTFMVIPG